jgi:hypothetical protein
MDDERAHAAREHMLAWLREVAATGNDMELIVLGGMRTLQPLRLGKYVDADTRTMHDSVMVSRRTWATLVQTRYLPEGTLIAATVANLMEIVNGDVVAMAVRKDFSW